MEPTDLCACDHVFDEHAPGGGECLIAGCPCSMFDDEADPDDYR